MKIIYTTPMVLGLVLITNSCGTSPDSDDPVVRNPVPPIFQQPVSNQQTAIPVDSAMPVANPVVGRPGYVFNPYNQNMVEVKGMASGTKVRDPQDPNPSHIFVVP